MRRLDKKGLKLHFLLGIAILVSVIILILGNLQQKAEVKDRQLGTSQLAVLNLGQEADAAGVYLDAAAVIAAEEAVDSFYEQGAMERDYEEGDYPCGEFLGHPYWFDGQKLCIPDMEQNLRNIYRGKFYQELSASTYAFPYAFSYDFAPQPDGTVKAMAASEDDFTATAVGASTTALEISTGEPFTPDYTGARQPVTLNSGGRGGNEVRIVVVHYTAGDTLSGAVSTLQRRGLSYHYIIDKDGTINQYVPESRSAQHAGCPNDHCKGDCCLQPGMNQPSIGISFVNVGYRRCTNANKDWHKAGNLCWQPYTDAQIESFQNLLADIASRHPETLQKDGKLNREAILMHSEIDRDKSDPGPAFTDDKDAIYDGVDDILAALNDIERPPAELPQAQDNQITTQAIGTVDRIESYGVIIEKYAQERDIDVAIIKALIDHESKGYPNLKSPANALGLMQIVPFSTGGTLINHDTCVQSGCGFTPAASMDEVKVDEYYTPEKNICCGTYIFKKLTMRKPISWDCTGKNINPGLHIQKEYTTPYEIGARRYNGAGCGVWADPDYVETIMGLYSTYGGSAQQVGYFPSGGLKIAYSTPLGFTATLPINLEKLDALEGFVRGLTTACTDLIEDCFEEQLKPYNENEDNLFLQTDCTEMDAAEQFANRYTSCLEKKPGEECVIKAASVENYSKVSLMLLKGGMVANYHSSRTTVTRKELLEPQPPVTAFILADGVVQEGEMVIVTTDDKDGDTVKVMISVTDEDGKPKNVYEGKEQPVDETYFTFLKKADGSLAYLPEADNTRRNAYEATHLLCTDETGGHGTLTFALKIIDRTPPPVTELAGYYHDFSQYLGGETNPVGALVSMTGMTGRYEVSWKPATAYPDGPVVPDVERYEVYCSAEPFTAGELPPEDTLVKTITRSDEGYFDPQAYNKGYMAVAIDTCAIQAPLLPSATTNHLTVIAFDRFGQYDKDYPTITLTQQDTTSLSGERLNNPNAQGEVVAPPSLLPFPLTAETATNYVPFTGSVPGLPAQTI